MDPNKWYSTALLITFSALGAACLAIVVYLIGWGDLTTAEASRNVLTIVFTIGTISIAIIIVLAVLLQQGATTVKERFEAAREIFTVLIGIVGTIVGFYFGSAKIESALPPPPATESAQPEVPPATALAK